MRLVKDAAHDLAFDTGHHDFTPPSLAEVHAEWIGRREGISATELQPSGLSEKEKYERLMQQVNSPLVILYLFGGNLQWVPYFISLPYMNTPSQPVPFL